MVEQKEDFNKVKRFFRAIEKSVSAQCKKVKYWFIANKYARIAALFKKRGKRVRVGFFVIYESSFPAAMLLEKMLDDPLFLPSIVVIPDKARGEINERQALCHTIEYMQLHYGDRCEVISSYNAEKNCYIDIMNRFDIICSSNPYRRMTDDKYTVEYAKKHNVLSFFIGYGYVISKWGLKHILNAPSCNLCWRLYLETYVTASEASTQMKNRARNVKVFGYSKMDRLSRVEVKERKRKCIIIAPHHTVNMPELPLSNFMAYSNFFIELPKRYPEIDFIFRPHPLLKVTLANESIWGKEKTDAYFETMSSYPNVVYQDGGDYFDTFVNSDGIIHDCGSFVAEYLFTGHPPCYLLKDETIPDNYCNKLMKECLKVHYRAFNITDVINYIENVIIQGNDSLATQRRDFFERELRVKYPDTTSAILEDIKQGLGFSTKKSI